MEPTPGLLSTQMRPFCASVRVFAMESPTPVSPTPWIRTLSARYRRVKTRAQIFGGDASAGIADLDQDVFLAVFRFRLDL